MTAPPAHALLQPTFFGPAPLFRLPGTSPDCTSLSIGYLVDPAAVEPLLPSWTGRDGGRYGFRPHPVAGGAPMLRLVFAHSRDVDALGGDDYTAVAVTVTAGFTGERPWIHRGARYAAATGYFGLVAWESDPWAAITGREIFGVPKLVAEIPELVTDDDAAPGHARFEVLDRAGHAFVTGEATLAEVSPEAPVFAATALTGVTAGRGTASAGAAGAGGTGSAPVQPGHWAFGWKHIPAPDLGAPDLAYAVGFVGGGFTDPDDPPGTALPPLAPPRAGDGSVRVGRASGADLPDAFHIVAALGDLLDRHCEPFPGNAMLLRNRHHLFAGHRLDGPYPPAERAERRG